MKTKVITDNTSEKLIITWDRTRFILIQKYKGSDELPIPRVIILNPKEMRDLVDFACTLDKIDEES